MLPKLNENLQTELQIKGSIERVTGVHGSTEEIFLTLVVKYVVKIFEFLKA